MISARNCDPDTVRALLSLGATVSLKDESGFTALEYLFSSAQVDAGTSHSLFSLPSRVVFFSFSLESVPAAREVASALLSAGLHAPRRVSLGDADVLSVAILSGSPHLVQLCLDLDLCVDYYDANPGTSPSCLSAACLLLLLMASSGWRPTSHNHRLAISSNDSTVSTWIDPPEAAPVRRLPRQEPANLAHARCTFFSSQ